MISLETVQVLLHVLSTVRLDVGSDSFEADAAALIAAKRELREAIQESRQQQAGVE